MLIAQLAAVAMIAAVAPAPPKREAVENLLKVFGLSAPAHLRPDSTPPKYMLDLYHSTVDRRGVSRAPNPYNAKVIRSYTAVPRGDAGDGLRFNLTGIGDDEHILGAELHVFSAASRLRRDSVCQMSVYQVVREEGKLQDASSHRLLDAKYVLLSTAGWVIFDVREAAEEWTRHQGRNRRLVVAAACGPDLRSPGPGVPLRFGGHPEKQPLLVVFAGRRTGDDPFVQQGEISAAPRRSGGDWETGRGVLLPTPSSPGASPSLGSQAERRRRSTTGDAPGREDEEEEADGDCASHEMKVDFSEIGWSSWIISPKEYNAYSCRGRCRFPLNQAQRPTNHATVQSIVHELGLHENVTVPCCVPTRLLSLSLLYFDENNNVVIKQYDDMIAEHCGCH